MLAEACRRQAASAWCGLQEALPPPWLSSGWRCAWGSLPRVAARRPGWTVLPEAVATPAVARGAAPQPAHARTPAGCVQPALAPNINAAARVLDRLGITLLGRRGWLPRCAALSSRRPGRPGATCGAISTPGGPTSRPGIEAIVVTASGCGVQVCDYGPPLARRTRLRRESGGPSANSAAIPARSSSPPARAFCPCSRNCGAERGRLAFHARCSLRHGLRIRGIAEELLAACGRPDAGGRRASLLRLGGQPIPYFSLNCRNACATPAGGAQRGRAGGHRHRQYRLFEPPSGGQRDCRSATGSNSSTRFCK